MPDINFGNHQNEVHNPVDQGREIPKNDNSLNFENHQDETHNPVNQGTEILENDNSLNSEEQNDPNKIKVEIADEKTPLVVCLAHQHVARL